LNTEKYGLAAWVIHWDIGAVVEREPQGLAQKDGTRPDLLMLTLTGDLALVEASQEQLGLWDADSTCALAQPGGRGDPEHSRTPEA